MTLQSVTPAQARQLVANGALLLDVREPDEHARERIPQARNLPLGQLPVAPLPADGRTVVFHCRSGARTCAHAVRLAALVPGGEAFLLEGGLDAWKRAGLPVLTDRRQPIEILRQVQIVAGSLVVLGVVLGATVSPVFHALAAFVGAGLLFAGIRGSCAMARLLRLMPWNRRAA